MKTLKIIMLVVAGIMLVCPVQLKAQDESQRPQFVVMTTIHWDMENSDGSRKEWRALEKEYLEKVTEKNEFILSTAVLNHFYTADNSELIRIATYKTWADIEAAQARNGELTEAAWPDESERDAFFEKRNAYFTNFHSDEIYRTIPGAKFPAVQSDESKIVYMQKSHVDFPDDGSMDEIQAIRKEYVDAVIRPNSLLLAYYPLRHGWGADNREVIDIFIYNSLSDLEASAKAEDDLINAHWPDEAKRDAFFDRQDEYYSGWHGDFIYRSMPQISK